MWLFLPNAFFSVVEDYSNKKNLMVRARFSGDIQSIFNVSAEHTPQNDYPYRASVPKEMVAQVVANNILRINYGNFKNQAEDDTSEQNKSAWIEALHEVWSVMVNAGDASIFKFPKKSKFKAKSFDFAHLGGYFNYRKK